MSNELFSTSEVAKRLGVSRVTVFKRIKDGSIKAEKVGRNFVIRASDVPTILERTVSANNKQAIERAIQKTVQEYRVALELLGKE